jgi:hypothetical protein
LGEAIEIRKDWYDATQYLEQYLIGDDIKQKTTNLDSISDDAYADIVLDNDGYTGEFEGPLKKWLVVNIIRNNKYPEYIEDIPSKFRREVLSELEDIIGSAFLAKDAEQLQ